MNLMGSGAMMICAAMREAEGLQLSGRQGWAVDGDAVVDEGVGEKKTGDRPRFNCWQRERKGETSKN